MQDSRIAEALERLADEARTANLISWHGLGFSAPGELAYIQKRLEVGPYDTGGV